MSAAYFARSRMTARAATASSACTSQCRPDGGGAAGSAGSPAQNSSKSGFGSAYVGSANLSGAALTGGLEWTVKLTQRAQEALFARAVAHFETLWADSEFQRINV